MNRKFFCMIALFQLVSARHTVHPKFFGQDSFVIVDANKVPTNRKHIQRNGASHHHRPMHYPAYQIISENSEQLKPAIDPSTDSSPATSTMTAPLVIFTKEDYPNDLLDIARNKLGIRSPDEIPSIGELGELLGTQSVDETIKYIRELTSTEEGIAFIKAYIESTDYTDSTASSTAIPIEAKPPSDEISIKNTKDGPQQTGLFERLSAYLNMFNIFSSMATKTEDQGDSSSSLQRIDRVSTFGKIHPAPISKDMVRYKNVVQKPVLVHHPLPYHYPIPLRPALVYRPKTNTGANLQTVVHLNTPKTRQSQLRSISYNSFNWPTKSIKLHKKQQQEELENLAARVSKFPLAHDRKALIDAQYAGAVEKAFTEDEELKAVLGSTTTLK